jgi:hypothetical protein
MKTQAYWDVFLGEPEDGGSMVIRNNDNIYLLGDRESVTISME